MIHKRYLGREQNYCDTCWDNDKYLPFSKLVFSVIHSVNEMECAVRTLLAEFISHCVLL